MLLIGGRRSNGHRAASPQPIKYIAGGAQAASVVSVQEALGRYLPTRGHCAAPRRKSGTSMLSCMRRTGLNLVNVTLSAPGHISAGWVRSSANPYIRELTGTRDKSPEKASLDPAQSDVTLLDSNGTLPPGTHWR